MPDTKTWSRELIDKMVSEMDITGFTFEYMIEELGVPIEMLHPYMDAREPGADEWDERPEWRDEPPKSNGHDKQDQPPQPFPTISAATLKGQQKPRQFLDNAQIFPARNVALFSGEGAIGKSLFILQLALACTTGTQWLGIDVNQGPVLYFSCEDDRDEITNRVNEVCDAENIDLGNAHHLEIMDMVGEPTVLAIEDKTNGGVKSTPILARLVVTIAKVSPVLVILDNLADIFGGNENNRVHAKQFITLLRNVCIKHNTIVIILGHPSNTGVTSGSGMSGSTAWNNSVRCRPYLHKPDGADADDRTRIFEVMKANYSPQGNIRWEVEWHKGRFIRSQPKSAFDRITVDDVDKVRDRFAAQRHRVSEQSGDWGGYAVADILGWDVGRGIGAKERSTEQNRNRANIRTYLGTWVRASSIFIVDGFTQKREKTQFYSNKPGLSVV